MMMLLSGCGQPVACPPCEEATVPYAEVNPEGVFDVTGWFVDDAPPVEPVVEVAGERVVVSWVGADGSTEQVVYDVVARKARR